MRKTNWMIGVVAVFAAFALAGCADQSGMEQLNKNEFTLRGMIAADRQQIDALKAQVARAERSDRGTPAWRRHRRRQRVRRERSRREPRGRSEGAAGGHGSDSGRGAAARSAGGQRRSRGDVASTEPPAGGPAPPATPAEIAPTWPTELDQEIAAAATSNEPGIKIYREGLDAMKAGKYPLAVARFTKLQHAYPKSPLSEPAEYFAANALFETGGYDQAILQFNDLVMRFPKGKYASAALLREAQAFVKLNDRIDARLTLQKLVADHAGTPEAASADTMMKDLASD